MYHPPRVCTLEKDKILHGLDMYTSILVSDVEETDKTVEITRKGVFVEYYHFHFWKFFFIKMDFKSNLIS